jgi:hypothetical protein
MALFHNKAKFGNKCFLLLDATFFILLHIRKVLKKTILTGLECGLCQPTGAGDQALQDMHGIGLRIKEWLDRVEYKLGIPPWEIGDAVVGDDCVLDAGGLLGDEQGDELLFFAEVGLNEGHGELEEVLEGSAGGFSHSVNLLVELLEVFGHETFVELRLTGAHVYDNLWIFRSHNQMDELVESCHGLLTDPATNITSAVNCVVVIALVECLEHLVPHLLGDILEPKFLDHQDKRVNGLLSRLSII